MKRYHCSLIAFLTVLAPCVAVAASPASAEPVRLDQISPPELFERRSEADWAARLAILRALELKEAGGWNQFLAAPGPVIRALDPEEVQRWKELPADKRQEPPIVRERDAILPHPSNGRELVDRVLAPEMPTEPIDVPTTTIASRQRVSHLQRVAPNCVLPIAAGVAGLR